VPENAEPVSYWERNRVPNEPNRVIKDDHRKLVKQSIRLKRKGIGTGKGKGNTHGTNLSGGWRRKKRIKWGNPSYLSFVVSNDLLYQKNKLLAVAQSQEN
jgi:hypothetical protein